MHENNKEDILCSRVNPTFLSLKSEKTKILIIGGGKAALIKARTFLENGCEIVVISRDFIEGLSTLQEKGSIKLILGEYNKSYIKNCHIVVIATNDLMLNRNIRKDCDEIYKIYIDCSSPHEGLCITPCQRRTKNISFGLHTNLGSPKTSVYISNKMKNILDEYDDFVEFTAFIRNRIKNSYKKREIMNFICSDDFYFFIKMGKASQVFNMFYDENLF